jgi:hypothetical protein
MLLVLVLKLLMLTLVSRRKRRGPQDIATTATNHI